MNVLEFQRDSLFHQHTSVKDTEKVKGSYVYLIVVFAVSLCTIVSVMLWEFYFSIFFLTFKIYYFGIRRLNNVNSGTYQAKGSRKRNNVTGFLHLLN